MLNKALFERLQSQIQNGMPTGASENGWYNYRGLKYSLGFRALEARQWIEVRIVLVELNETEAIELMATALAMNAQMLHEMSTPSSIGMIDEPPRLVYLLRLEGYCPSVVELFNLLEAIQKRTQILNDQVH